MANPNIKPEEQQPLTPPAPYTPTTYAPPTPTAKYEGSNQADLMQQMINEWATRTDPQAQAEQDARIRRGREVWTGANLFANVIANAINARGTAKGAPSMTWSDNQQKMFDDWRTADRELKADRRAAQQRLDALRLQDAQFRMADAQARDKAALDAYNRNYEAGEKANAANWQRGVSGYETERKRRQKLEDDETAFNRQKQMAGINNAAAAARQQAGFDHQENMAKLTEERQTKLAQLKHGYNPDDKRVLVGNSYFKADNQNEASNHIWAVYEMLRNAYNADDGQGKARVAGMPNSGYMNPTSDIDEAVSFIGRTFRSAYRGNPGFKADYDAYSKEYSAQAAAKPQTTQQEQQNNTGNGGESGLF